MLSFYEYQNNIIFSIETMLKFFSNLLNLHSE